jgi:signal peptidase I
MNPTTPEAANQPPKPHHPPDNIRSIISTVAILIIAPVIAIILTLFVFQSYQVSGQSMEIALQNNDRLIIWKLPKTWAKITGHAYVPHRGDIIVLHDDKLASVGEDAQKQLIKRVIALPGERLVVKNGKATIYNKEHPNGFMPDATLPYGGGGALIPETEGNIDIVIPAGQIFVMGDNRDHSLDSRTLGPVPVQNIVGKLVVRILPFTNMDTF